MNNFLASGGDNFTVFREGTDATGGLQDVDALEAYIAAAGSLTPPVPGPDRGPDSEAVDPPHRQMGRISGTAARRSF